MMDFIVKLMDFVLKMMHFILKMIDFVNSRLKALGPFLMKMRTCSDVIFPGNCTMGDCASRCQVYL